MKGTRNMIKKFKNVLVVAASVFALMTPVLVPAAASADISSTDFSGNACSGTNGDLSGGDQNCGGGTSALQKIIKTAIDIMSIIVGTVAVIMIIVGGLKYITSGGESGNITGAKNTIVYALVGLVIVALAQFIVHFVLNKAVNGVAAP
ncbi:MAG TPA: pilin [Candidatus Saccharimonadales bacterium]|jgi:hypothetical protein